MEVRYIFKYPCARAYYDTLHASNTPEEMHELLVVGLESDLGMVKIEPDHPTFGVDSLLARLGEQCTSNWDVPPSRSNILRRLGVVGYTRAASVDPTAAQVLLLFSRRLSQLW